MNRIVAALIAPAILLTGAAALAITPTVNYSTGFETGEGYTTGPLIDNVNWYGIPSPNAGITVQNTVAQSGTQAVKMDASTFTEDSTFAIHLLDDGLLDPVQVTAKPYVRVQWGMRLAPLGETDVPTQFWAMDLYTMGVANIATAGIWYEGGQYSVRGTNADGDLPSIITAPARDTWNTFAILLDFNSRTYNVEMNGTVITPSAMDFITGSAMGDDKTLGETDLLNGFHGTDMAYFDNILITSSAVPEPASVALVAMGLIATSLRRRG